MSKINKTNEMIFFGYTIRTQQQAPFQSIMFLTKSKNRKMIVESAISTEDSIKQAQAMIKKYREEFLNWESIDAVELDFNVDFVRGIMDNVRVFSFDPTFTSNEISFYMYDDEEIGMYKTWISEACSASKTRISIEDLQTLGLIPNARYTIEIKDDAMCFIFHSIVENPNDVVHLGFPGATVCAWKKNK